MGIPADRLQAVFDMFTQVEPSAEGLGIGLALVRTLAELHGGSVEASSEGNGRGSQFTVRLPSLQAASAAPPKVLGKMPTTPNPRRLLIVEDHADVAESLAMILEEDDHAVRIAPDGPTALQALTEFKPDVVLLDVGLPGMDGYQVARRDARGDSSVQPDHHRVERIWRDGGFPPVQGSRMRRPPRKTGASERSSQAAGRGPADHVVDLSQPLASSAGGGLRPSHHSPRGVGSLA